MSASTDAFFVFDRGRPVTYRKLAVVFRRLRTISAYRDNFRLLLAFAEARLGKSPTAVRTHGKGRKERSVPLWRSTVADLKRWLHEYPRDPEQPLFPNRSGGPLTRVGVSERLKLAVRTAAHQYREAHR